MRCAGGAGHELPHHDDIRRRARAAHLAGGRRDMGAAAHGRQVRTARARARERDVSRVCGCACVCVWVCAWGVHLSVCVCGWVGGGWVGGWRGCVCVRAWVCVCVRARAPPRTASAISIYIPRMGHTTYAMPNASRDRVHAHMHFPYGPPFGMTLCTVRHVTACCPGTTSATSRRTRSSGA